MKTSPVIIALDLDGTLLDLAGAGSRAVFATARELLQLDADPQMSFVGRTDRSIIGDFLRDHADRKGLPQPAEGDLRRFFARYLEILPQELARTPYHPTPGAAELVEALKSDPLVTVGVVTGNIEAAAWLKLRSAGLPLEYDFGAFGEEASERSDLLRLGWERGRTQASLAAELIVVGDTPADISAAREVGARSAAIAAGPYSLQRLLAEGPTWAYETPAEALRAIFWR